MASSEPTVFLCGLKEEPEDQQDLCQSDPDLLLNIKKEETFDTPDPPRDVSTGLKEEPTDSLDSCPPRDGSAGLKEEPSDQLELSHVSQDLKVQPKEEPEDVPVAPRDSPSSLTEDSTDHQDVYRTAEATAKRSKRSPAFNAEEMAILVEEVWEHRHILFDGTKGKKSILAKNRIWNNIACRIAPSSPRGLRDWAAVRKKWQDFQSQTKKKAAKIRRIRKRTGGGSDGDTSLSPEEERALAIIAKTASEDIEGVVDVLGDEGISEPSVSGKDEPPGNGTGAASPASPAARSSPAHDAISRCLSSVPVPRRQPPPASHGIRIHGGFSRQPVTATRSWSEMLVDVQRETLVVLRGMKDQLDRITTFQQEMVNIRREELELQRRQVALAEAQLNRPSLSGPSSPPQNSGDADAEPHM